MQYTEYDVSRDQAAAEEMVRLTGQMGVPVITVDGETIIGFDRPRLQALLAGHESHKRPRLGLKVADAGQLARKPGEPPLFGAVVGGVSPSSAGARAGIRAGDIITSINNQRINNAAELEEAAGRLPAGSQVPVTYYRKEQAIKSKIAL